MDRPKKPKSDDLIQTPEELKKTAESFADLPKEFQISGQELEMVQEEALGKPMHYGTPAEAIEAMQRRISVLKQQKAEILDAIENCEDESQQNELMQQVEELNRDIARAQTRLDSYEFQQRQEN